MRKKFTPLSILYSVTFVFSIHYAFVLYINSSFLGQFFSTQEVGAIFTVGSIFSLISLLYMPKLLNRFGIASVTEWFLYILAGSALGLAYTKNGWLAMILFFLLYNLQLLIRYILDIYIEKYSKFATTGKTRGIFLTIINFAIAMSPIAVGAIIARGNLETVYLASALLALVTIAISNKTLHHIKDLSYHEGTFISAFKKIWDNKDIFHIFSANILLEFFYAWMVIYTPIYLSTILGFSWETIGIIFSVMLIPFAVFELPAGYIADKYIGEKEILGTGFFIMGISTIALSFISGSSALVWATALFITRTGASLAEIMIDTYFFKKVSTVDTDIIAAFRGSRSIALIIAPAAGILVITFLPMQYLFSILGALMFIGILNAIKIQDTK